MRLSVFGWLSLVASLLAIVVSLVRVVLAKISSSRLEVGSVSNKWIAEHRTDPDIVSR